MHDVAQLAAGGLFGAPLHRAEIVGDHIAKADPLASKPGGLVHQRGAEHGFEAAHQAAGGAFDIGVDSLAADQNGAVHFVEDRTRNRRLFGFQHRQNRHMAVDRAERGVRRSEIKSAD